MSKLHPCHQRYLLGDRGELVARNGGAVAGDYSIVQAYYALHQGITPDPDANGRDGEGASVNNRLGISTKRPI